SSAGVIPDVAPAFWHYYTDDITWPSTYFLVADMLYRQYGDLRPVEKHYASMKKWVSHIHKKYMVDYLIPKDKYGDWCMPPAEMELIHARDSSRITDGELIATAYYYHVLTIMRYFARLLRNPIDAQHDSLLAGKIKKAFNKKFLNKKTCEYCNNTVTANILPLYFGITPVKERQKVFENVVNEITNVYHDHISTGVIGTSWLMRVLTEYGRPDIAYDIVTNRTYPGWGYMVAEGATTIWELWNGNKANPRMSSRNHVMLLGDLIVWFYENLAGIKSDVQHPGFKKIVMKPVLIDSLKFVHASYHSIHGWIRSSWDKEEYHFKWNISIPGNTQAIIYIPAYKEKEITESGRNISSVKGIRFVNMTK
ncbi:MAG: alpha-L-rhamnosidase C-terminal domain-containing protein, partial [Chitinophagaceae bacterium]